MEIAYSDEALEHLQFWKQSGNKKVMQKITSLILAIEVNPYDGIGKPEPLKHQLAGL